MAVAGRSWSLRAVQSVVFCCLLAGAAFFAGLFERGISMVIEIELPAPAEIVLFHSAAGVFREPERVTARYRDAGRRQRVVLPAVPADGRLPSLRLDIEGAGVNRGKIYAIEFRGGKRDHLLGARRLPRVLSISHDIAELSIGPDGAAAFAVTGADPYFVLSAGLLQHYPVGRAPLALYAVLIALAGLAYFFAAPWAAPRAALLHRRLDRVSAWRPENLYLALALLIETPLFVLSPPFSVADEQAHFYKAYKLIAGGAYSHAEGVRPETFTVPQGLVELYQPARAAAAPGRMQKTAALRRIPLGRDDVAVVDSTYAYSPVPYLFSAAGIGAGLAGGLSPLALLYLGRLCNLAAWMLIIWLSIRILPFQKRLLMLYAFLPTNAYVAASLSADVITNALFILCCALFLSLAWGRRHPLMPGAMLAQAVVSSALSLCKTLYFFGAGLVLLVSPRRAGGWGRYLAWVSALAALNLALVHRWSAFIRMPFAEGQGPSARLLDILLSPALLWELLQNTIERHGGYLYHSFISQLSWGYTPIASFVLVLYPAALIAAALSDNPERRAVNLWRRALMIGCAAGVSILIVAAYYTLFPAAGEAPVAAGLQGRYFIAPVFLLLLAFTSRRALIRPARIALPAAAFSLACGAAAVSAVLDAYYS